MNHKTLRENFAVMNNAYAKYSFDYFLDSLKRLGINKIDLWGGVQHFDPFAATEKSISEMKSRLTEQGMEIITYTPELLAYPYNFASPDRKVRKMSVDFAVRNLDIAQAFGVDTMLISPGWGLLDLPVETSRKYSMDCISRIAEAARERGICLLLEHLTPQSSNLLYSVRAVQEMIESVNHPALCAVLDLGQMSVFGEKVSDYISALGSKLRHIHIMDGSPSCHLAFGDGILPLEDYWKELRASGYKGYYTLEINDGRYAGRPHEALQKCIDALLKWEDAS